MKDETTETLDTISNKKGFIGITSFTWWDFIKDKNIGKINFWNKRESFKCLTKGEYFFFLKKNSDGENGERKVVGYAEFVEFKKLSLSNAWEEFKEGNGFSNLNSFTQSAKGLLDDQNLNEIGCIVLNNLKVFDKPKYLSSLGIQFENSIVSGKIITPEECAKILVNKTSKAISYSHNRIIFGAPGTGKSFKLDKDLKDETGTKYFTYYERVTFHPSYSYANFVGTYKPVKDEKGDGQITYEFVEGPFIRVLRQALCDTEGNNYLLIIEEINRANVTAVFGDVFQLLDRDSSNCSQYQVAASEDLHKHLIKHGVPEDKAAELRIPSNMYIWATMNSADQGVQPLDTAFKRRWEFEYLDINNSEEKIDASMKNIQFPDQTMDWNLLRHLINNRLSSNYNINEDKLLGPFFIRKGNQTDEQFIKSFKSKVLMYLFEDVCKINPKPLFTGISETKLYFSNIVSSFEKDGIKIFNFSNEEINKAKSEIEKTGE